MMRLRALVFLAAGLASCASPAMHHAARAAPDPPAYRWRGVGLDVARRYFAPATLRRFIDVAAHYRLNAVHLHLTDNEAWRLPSRRYPRLPSRLHYTESQLRRLDAYALAHGVHLVPEIDLPAHAAAAIRAYPSLACGASDTLCPRGSDRFAGDVVTEALELFHSRYIHTGGDEVTGWSTEDRRRFERSLDRVVKRAHRTMIVWDDEADAAPADVVVEVWHLRDATAAAAKRGHEIVAAPDGPLYFDAVQGQAAQEPQGSPYMSTLEEIYAYSPPSDAFGVEAMLWTEHISDDAGLWYMLLPREIAFSAVASDGNRKAPWPAFRDRTLPAQLRWLVNRSYPFRVPNALYSVDDPDARYTSVAGNQNAAVLHSRRRQVRVTLASVLPMAHVFYRTASHTQWIQYEKPFAVELVDGSRIDARTMSKNGRIGAISSLFLSTSPAHDSSRRFDDVVSP